MKQFVILMFFIALPVCAKEYRLFYESGGRFRPVADYDALVQKISAEKPIGSILNYDSRIFKMLDYVGEGAKNLVLLVKEQPIGKVGVLRIPKYKENYSEIIEDYLSAHKYISDAKFEENGIKALPERHLPKLYHSDEFSRYIFLEAIIDTVPMSKILKAKTDILLSSGKIITIEHIKKSYLEFAKDTAMIRQIGDLRSDSVLFSVSKGLVLIDFEMQNMSAAGSLNSGTLFTTDIDTYVAGLYQFQHGHDFTYSPPDHMSVPKVVDTRDLLAEINQVRMAAGFEKAKTFCGYLVSD